MIINSTQQFLVYALPQIHVGVLYLGLAMVDEPFIKVDDYGAIKCFTHLALKGLAMKYRTSLLFGTAQI